MMDFSKVVIEHLFEDLVDFEHFWRKSRTYTKNTPFRWRSSKIQKIAHLHLRVLSSIKALMLYLDIRDRYVVFLCKRILHDIKNIFVIFVKCQITCNRQLRIIQFDHIVYTVLMQQDLNSRITLSF